MGLYAKLSCSAPRDPRMIAAGWQARAVYVEALLYCRENLTDGVIDRRALIYWMPDMPARTRQRHLDRLVELEALETHGDGWAFPEHVWRKWNPTKAEVEDMRQQKADAGIRGNHERWHVGPDGSPSPKCPLCRSDRKRIAPCESGAIAKGSPESEPESESESEPERETNTPPPTDDYKEGVDNSEAVVTELANRRRLA